MTGWAKWGEITAPQPVIELQGIDTARYCPRCDLRTLWTNLDGALNLSCSDCNLAISEKLSWAEDDRMRRHYGLIGMPGVYL